MTERVKPRGFTRLFNAFGNSLRGFGGAFREEAAFRQELALAVVVIPAGLWLGRNGIERASKTLRNITSAWVKEQRVDIKNGAITGYQVNMMVTFIIDD